MNNSELDITRNFFYSFFSLCFVPWRIDAKKEHYLQMIKTIKESGLDASFMASAEKLYELQNNQNSLNIEYDKIFAAPFGSLVGMSASYYHEGYEAGAMLQKTKDTLCELGVIKEGDFNAPEDHFGCLFDAMSYAITLKMGSNESGCTLESLQKKLFSEVINPNVDFLIADIFQTNECEAYKAVAKILEGFLAFERSYLEIDAPKERSSSKVVDINSFYRKREKREDKGEGSCDI